MEGGINMTFAKGYTNPRKLAVIGSSCLVLALLWWHFPQATGSLGASWRDGLQGVLFGLSIGFNLVAVRLKARQRSCGDTPTLTTT
jgi:hypothetical protein